MFIPSIHAVHQASRRIARFMPQTPLQYSEFLSLKYGASIYLKREDLTPIGAYKLRGGSNLITSLLEDYNAVVTPPRIPLMSLHGYHKDIYASIDSHISPSDPNKKKINNLITCSAGNHAASVAYVCKQLQINSKIYMPTITPKQKIDNVKFLGSKYVEIILRGQNFDESYEYAMEDSKSNDLQFIHPFNDEKVIEGQATIGKEIMEYISESNIKTLDYVFIPIGGGGLAAGISAYIKQLSESTHIVGLQPVGAPSMFESIKQEKLVRLTDIDTWVDGASVKQPGNLTFPICKRFLNEIRLVNTDLISYHIIQMHNTHRICIEPAGAISLCGLDLMADQIKGKKVVCIVSGGNSDARRMPDFINRSKHLF
jgi:threonine dehydratase